MSPNPPVFHRAPTSPPASPPKPSGGGGATTSTRDREQVAQEALTLPSGVVPIRFSMGNLAAITSAEKLFRPIVVSTSAVEGAQIAVPLPFRGSVVALTLSSDTDAASGTARFQVFVNNVSGASLTWTIGKTVTEIFTPGSHAFESGDELDVRVTTQSFAPDATANVEVVAYLSQAGST